MSVHVIFVTPMPSDARCKWVVDTDLLLCVYGRCLVLCVRIYMQRATTKTLVAGVCIIHPCILREREQNRCIVRLATTTQVVEGM